MREESMNFRYRVEVSSQGARERLEKAVRLSRLAGSCSSRNHRVSWQQISRTHTPVCSWSIPWALMVWLEVLLLAFSTHLELYISQFLPRRLVSRRCARSEGGFELRSKTKYWWHDLADRGCHRNRSSFKEKRSRMARHAVKIRSPEQISECLKVS